MTKLQHLLHTFCKPQTVKTSILTILFVALCAPLFAQTVNVVSTGVYYGGTDPYCNGATTTTQDVGYVNTADETQTIDDVNYRWKPESNRTTNDPWVSSALIEYDQPYPTPTSVQYPNQCLGLCASFACSNLPVGQTTYSVAFPLQRITFDIFKYYNGKNPKNPDEVPSIRSIDVYPMQGNDYTKYTCGSYHCSNAGKDDNKNSLIAECLGAHWICDGTTTTASTATAGSFCWLATKKRKDACGTSDIGKRTNGDTTNCPAFQGQTPDSGKQCSYLSSVSYSSCCLGPGHSDCVIYDNNGAHTNETLSFCTGWDGFYEMAGEFGKSNGNFGYRATAYTNVPSDGVIADRIEISEMGVYPGHNGATQIPIQIDVTNVHTVRSTPSLVGNITQVSAQPYTFRYRLSKDADVRIALFDASTLDNATYAYVADSDWDQNTSNQTSFAASYGDATEKIVRTLVDWQPRTGEGMKGTDKDTQISDFDAWDGRNDDGLLLPAGNYLASIQAKSQDEWPGIDFSRAVTRQVSLDPLKLTDVQVTGLTKRSTAYATISYMATEPSTVYWEVYTPGTSFKTVNLTEEGHQVSATLTNSSAPTGTGPVLNNTGTLVYRSSEQKSGRINYVQRWDGTCQVAPGSKVPYMITNGSAYPSGAQDAAGNTLSGTCNNANGCIYYATSVTGGCTRTYAYKEKMANGATCNTKAGCTEHYAYGAPMPDGNYVYVLWAEIPYNGCYHNAADNNTTSQSTPGYYKKPYFEPNTSCRYNAANNNRQFTGVKTLKYTVGTLELERGLVGITMQPVGYATLGSSPTAYGLDPYIFKYALDREAQVIATVENTAGVVVKYLTLQEGEPNVANQLNTITWDGRDEQGRMVYPGTYMFRVKAMDAMFPAMSNQAIVTFPVDMYRVVDVATTDVYGDSNAKATISYHLSKTMNAQVNIYNKDVVIPHYNSTTGEYNDSNVTATYTGKVQNISGTVEDNGVTYLKANTATVTVNGTNVKNADRLPVNGSLIKYTNVDDNTAYRDTWTVASQYSIYGDRDLNQDLTNLNHDPSSPATLSEPNPHNNEPYATNEGGDQLYTVYLKREVLNTTTSTAAWPPRICATDDTTYGKDKTKSIFTGDYVDPAKVNQYQAECIYVNDKTFTKYPTLQQASTGVVDVRLQPIHTFDRSSLRIGDDGIVMEEWDALYFYNPTPDEGRHTPEEINKCKNQNEKSNCPYEMVPDGQYPFFISARSNEPFNRYYYDQLRDGKQGSSTYTDKGFKGNYTISGEPFRKGEEFNTCGTNGTGTGTSVCVNNIDVQQEDYLYASDKVVHKINVTRGPVYFLDGSVAVFPNTPQLFNASSTTMTFIPPYEINFSISRAAQVEVAIVALEPNMCSPVTDNVHSSTVNVYESRTNVAGDICKFLSTMTIRNTGHFDANAIRKMYWDGTDHTGNYVKPGIYEVRLTARNYPDSGLYQPTVKSITLNADLLKVFDLLENDNYAISMRGQNARIGYQVSVPMKVAIQIFKPGTTIYDYAEGTLRNPTTGKEVTDIREVLVRSIVGIRPGTTLVEEVWDGLDYAGQEVPDGVYPFRFVTSLDSARIDSVTGEIIVSKDERAMNFVADTYEYQNLHKATVAIGDGRFVCDDWKKTVFFYPNPLNDASKGTLEITKMPVPGTVSIKYFNLAGDLVRDGDYECVDANNYKTTMGSNLYFQPDNNVSTTRLTPDELDPHTGSFYNIRNAALRCRWDRTNQHGKKVARGVYFGLVDFKAYNGREHCQKVVKILIP